MAVGLNMQFGAAKETVAYGTRAVPTRFFEVTEAQPDFDVNYFHSAGLGGGVWRKRRVQTTRGGTVPVPMEVPTVGFGFFLDLMHPNAVTGVQQGATTAYLQTHTLDGAPTKSATFQIGVPETDSSTVVPTDYYGCMFSSVEFSWEPEGVLSAEFEFIARELNTAQTLASPSVPTSSLFSFKGGSITIGGSAIADVNGDGSMSLEWPMRDDAFPLGSTGLMSKPLPTDRPEASGELTADFTSLTHYNRVLDGTLADVVLTFEGATIASSFKERIVITYPDCGFTGSPPGVDGPGPVSETIAFTASSQTGDAPTITYQSTDTAP